MVDVPSDLELGLFDDPGDHTPLNLNIPNLGLGAVLRSFEYNLTRGSRLRLLAVSMNLAEQPDIDILVPVLKGAAGSADDPDSPDKGAVTHVLVEAKQNSKAWLLSKLRSAGVGALLIRDRAADRDDAETEFDHDADLLDLSAALCRVKTGPMTPSGTYQRQFWVMVTGDDARGLLQFVDDELTAESAGAVSVSGAAAVGGNVALSASAPAQRSAIEMIEHLEEVLQVPAETVLRAAGIKRRTYQHWKQTGAQPRLASQSHLWDLVLTVRGWEDVLGADLATWIRRPDRLDLLEAGAFDELTGQVLSQMVQQVEPSERVYRDRMAAGYFEAADRQLAESASDESAVADRERPVRRGRRVRRGNPPGRSST